MEMTTFDPAVRSLVDNIAFGDTAARTMTVKQAPLVGTAALVPLGEILGGSDPAAAKMAGEAIKRIVHNAARPGAKAEARAAAAQLVLLSDRTQPLVVRREALHLLGMVASRESVAWLGQLLADTDVRENARLALERVPSYDADKTLQAALKTAPPDYRAPIAQSLHHRRMTMRQVGTVKA